MTIPAAVVIQQAFLVDIDTKYQERLYFEFIPEEFTEDKSVNWENTPIIGRSEPIMGYADSGPRNFGLSLQFYASRFQDDSPKGGGDPYETVKTKVDWIRSLAYPDYTSRTGYLRPPHRVLYSVGQLFKSICIVNSVNVIYRGPWDERLLPMIAEVSVGLQETNSAPFSYDQVRDGKDFANMNERRVVKEIGRYNTRQSGRGVHGWGAR